MKNQALFSSKIKTKKLKCHLLQFLFGALSFNMYNHIYLLRNALSAKMRIVFHIFM